MSQKTIRIKCTLLYVLLTILTNTIYPQAWIGYTTTSVNFRVGPSTEYEIIKKLPANTILFIDSTDETNGFHLAIDENDNEGYVSTKYVRHYQNIKTTEGAAIESVGYSESYNPEIEITNDTRTHMTLRVNSTSYKFSPKETKTITISPGIIRYRASSPGIIPCFGFYTLESNANYTWRFYVVSILK